MSKQRANSNLKKVTKENLKTILEAHGQWLNFQARLSVSIAGSLEYQEISNKYPWLDAEELTDMVKEQSTYYQNIEQTKSYGARADLSYTDLSEMDLVDCDLSFAKMRHANLYYANLERANLRNADLSEAEMTHCRLFNAFLYKTNLSRAHMMEANFHSAYLEKANLSNSNLHRAVFYSAQLRHAKLMHADLREVDFSGANLEWANLTHSKLIGSVLRGAVMINTQLEHADLTGSDVYGVSSWDLKLDKTVESNLRITDRYDTKITVNSLEISQFLYLILNNDKIKQVVDSATSKIVLLLGRFTEERKQVLDQLRKALSKENYIPVLFDFEKPDSQNYTETITLLARMSGFIIGDLTDPASIPKELEAIVPTVMVPVKPIIEGDQHPFSMGADFLANNEDRFLIPFRYKDLNDLIKNLKKKIIDPCENARENLILKRNEALKRWRNV